MNPTYKISNEQLIGGAFKAAREMTRTAIKAGPVILELKRDNRSLDQNRKLWPMLQDVSSQVEWDGNRLTKDEWKNLFTGSMSEMKTVRAVGRPGIVMLGKSTKTLNKKQFSELIEFIYAFGAEHDVKWSEKSIETYECRND